jgi:CPA2 family monovalent cation:H+ antiporter-2
MGIAADMLLGGSDYGYQALSDIIPLRDIFSLMFFTSIGMLLKPDFLLNNLGTIILLVASPRALLGFCWGTKPIYHTL